MYENIQELLDKGWTLQVTPYVTGFAKPVQYGFLACVYYRRRGEGHNAVGSTVSDALDNLSAYVMSPSAVGWRANEVK